MAEGEYYEFYRVQREFGSGLWTSELQHDTQEEAEREMASLLGCSKRHKDSVMLVKQSEREVATTGWSAPPARVPGTADGGTP